MPKFLLLLAAIDVVCACSSTPPPAGAALSTPWGLTVSGIEKPRVFISNNGQDSVNAVNLANDLQALVFQESPAQYFPLRIPTGPAPADLAAPPGGEVVVVLDLLPPSLRLIDADTLRIVRDASGAPLVQRLGGLGSTPSAMVASPLKCAPPCVGHVYVALAGLGQIVEVEVQTGALIPSRLFDVGGEPSHLAIHPAGTFLYATDGDEVIQIPLQGSSLAQRRALGSEGGALAVSTNGKQLLVSRPQLRDVVLLSPADSAALALQNGNTRDAPTPACLRDCANLNAATCSAAHPSEQALCVGTTDYQQPAATYPGIYVDLLPAQILPLGDGAGHPPLRVTCIDSNGSSDHIRNYQEFAMLVGFDGTIKFLGLQSDDTDAVLPDVVSSGFCRGTVVSPMTPRDAVGIRDSVVADYLDTCVNAPAGMSRTLCIKDDSLSAGVLAFGRQAASSFFRLNWEAIVLDRSGNGAVLQSDGTLFDHEVDLAGLDVRVGDIVEIRTHGRVDSSCGEALCGLERRLTAIDNSSGGTIMTLDKPLNPACFRGTNPALAYRIRVADAFMVTPPSGPTERLKLGQLYGPGRDPGRGQRISFKLKQLATHSDLSPCERYDQDGRAQAPMPAVLSRLNTIGFKIADPSAPLVSGLSFDPQGQAVGTAGRLPKAAVAAPRDGAEPVVFISFSGADALLAVDPFNTALSADRDRYRVLR